jgi:hypothetical protein
MTKCNQPGFGLVRMDKEWFRCSYGNALIDPVPSHDGAEKNARDRRGIVEDGKG